MFDKITQKLKSEPLYGFLFILALLFMMLFSFCILQSDDYSYAAYFKDGLLGFFRLTKEHFISINGRALVHFFLHITLAMPAVFAVLIKSAVIFAIIFLSFKVSDTKNTAFYFTAFYSLLLLAGKDVFTQAIMWSSGFFNYVFPAMLIFFALYLYKKGSAWQYLLFVLAGATTEQWGFTAFAIITATTLASYSSLRKLKLTSFLPSLSVLFGYITIFLSPATRSRITVSGHIPLSESLFDISRMSEAFLQSGSPVIIIVLFISTALLAAFLKKGTFTSLYAGVLPLFLILTLPIHKSYMASFILFFCFLILCSVLFFVKKLYFVSVCLFGALASVLIMLPTNTFDSRITFPLTLLLILAILTLINELQFSKKALTSAASLLVIISLIVFCPSCMGYYKNHVTEQQNLAAIKASRKTNQLDYCIDYDKNYAVKQMFNDGWFYNAFISLYNLEDCRISLVSKNSVSLDSINTKGLLYNGEIYLPVREFLDENGGCLTTDKGIVMTLQDKTLTYLDGIFAYKTALGEDVYLVADDNRILDFYTLYIKLSVINDAFNLNIKGM